MSNPTTDLLKFTEKEEEKQAWIRSNKLDVFIKKGVVKHRDVEYEALIIKHFHCTDDVAAAAFMADLEVMNPFSMCWMEALPLNLAKVAERQSFKKTENAIPKASPNHWKITTPHI